MACYLFSQLSISIKMKSQKTNKNLAKRSQQHGKYHALTHQNYFISVLQLKNNSGQTFKHLT